MLKSIILFPHEARSAAAGTLRQIWRPIVRVKGLGAVTEFQKSDTRGFDWIMRDERMRWNDLRHDDLLHRAPCQPGDVLACREVWRIGAWRDDSRFALDYKVSPELKRTPWVLCPDESEARELRVQTLFELGVKGILPTVDGTYRWEPGQAPLRWRSPATTPAWAVRSWIKVQSVVVKRVQEMTEEDALAWGFIGTVENGVPVDGWASPLGVAYKSWNHRFSRRGLGWDKNPWCWTYTVEQAGRP